MSASQSAPLDPPLADELQARIGGTVSLPGSSGYASASPWNTSVLFEPAAVVSVSDARDVSTVIRFAGEHGLRVAVQATGHGATDRGADTLLIDTSTLQLCEVDPARQEARLGAGVTAGRLIAAAADHGLAAILGSAETVGAVGYLGGGGVGPLVSTFGLSSDYVESLDVVTGDGEIRHVSAAENPDLFWAFRGGKSTLGVVTELTLRLVPLTEIYGGAIWFDGHDAAAVLTAWTSWSATIPEDVTTSILLARLPAVGPPPPLAGRFVVAVRIGSVLTPVETEELLEPIRAAAEPVLDSVAVLPYRAVGRIHNEPTDPEPLVQDQALLPGFSETDAASLLEAFTSEAGAPLALAEVRRFGGALGREPGTASAFSFRSAPYGATAIGFAPREHAARTAIATDALIGALHGRSGRRTLTNFVATTDPHVIALAYDPATNARLDDLKRRYDPRAVLRP